MNESLLTEGSKVIAHLFIYIISHLTYFMETEIHIKSAIYI